MFSGCFTITRNSLSDRENDNMSFFNTSQLIQKKLWEIVAFTRHKFFLSFGKTFSNAKSVTILKKNQFEIFGCQLLEKQKQIFKRTYAGENYELELLASAYYTYCYSKLFCY